jgi:hypothetical protein
MMLIALSDSAAERRIVARPLPNQMEGRRVSGSGRSCGHPLQTRRFRDGKGFARARDRRVIRALNRR